MTDAEAASLGSVLKRVYKVLRGHTQAERIYQLSTMEGQPHYHTWLVPRRKEDVERGLKFLARDDSCEDAEAAALAEKLREAMR
jgi:diadenosine tetraphosphate (Ap4A) HIT family hydrolase